MTNDSHPAVKDPEIIAALAHFFRYLLELDDYTLGIIGRMITLWHDKKVVNVGTLSEEHGCSRQAMHRKILNIIGQHPELSALFSMVLPKLSRSRRCFLMKRAFAV